MMNGDIDLAQLEAFLRMVILEPEISPETRKAALNLLSPPDYTAAFRTITNPVGGSFSTPTPVKYELTQEQYAKIRELVKGGNKIQAIKELRVALNIGLKEAKDTVEFAINWDNP